MLHLVRLAQLCEKPVQRLDGGSDLHWRRMLVQRTQIVRRAAEELGPDPCQGGDPSRDAGPRQRQRRQRDEKRGQQARGEDFPDQAIALVQGFCDLHIQARVGSDCRDAYGFAVITAVEE